MVLQRRRDIETVLVSMLLTTPAHMADQAAPLYVQSAQYVTTLLRPPGCPIFGRRSDMEKEVASAQRWDSD